MHFVAEEQMDWESGGVDLLRVCYAINVNCTFSHDNAILYCHIIWKKNWTRQGSKGKNFYHPNSQCLLQVAYLIPIFTPGCLVIFDM